VFELLKEYDSPGSATSSTRTTSNSHVP